MKTCTKCGIEKDISEFSKKCDTKDGHRSSCKRCNSFADAAYKQAQRIKKMNHAKFQSIYNGLPQNLKKIYDVVPIKESWGETMIISELARIGHNYSGNVSMIGILNRLQEKGLIKETETGKFCKIPITEKIISQERSTFSLTIGKKEQVEQVKPKSPDSTFAPISQLNELALQAMQIASLCKILSSNIETAAINVDDHIKNAEKDSEKLKQLQTLLKG